MKLTLRVKRVILAGILIAIAILMFYATTSLLKDREDILQKVDNAKEMLLKEREILKQADSYKNQVQKTSGSLSTVMTRLLPGDNSSVASAELQKVLRDFADQSGVEITQKNTLQEKKVQDNDILTKVSVHIETNCDLDQLVNFLTAIENYDKFLKVEELVINSFRIQKRYEIRPSLTVVGYISSPNPKPAEGASPGAEGIRKTASAAQNQAGR